MKICLLSNNSRTNEKNVELAKICAPNHLTYALKHGYTQHSMRIDFEESKLGWLKTLKHLLPQFDIVFAHGVDTLYMNQRIRIEDLCVEQGHTHGVMMAKEEHTDNFLNNDVSVWWSDKDSMALIDRLIADYEIWVNYDWLHQSHLFNLLQKEEWVRKVVKLAAARDLNASPGGDNYARWKYGSFICHLLGCDENTKIPVARAMLRKVSADGCYYPPSETYRRIKRRSQRNPRAVFIGIPSYKPEMHFSCGQSISAFMIWAKLMCPDWHFFIHQLVGTGVPKLRDHLVWSALNAINPTTGKADYGKILMIDSDMAFNPPQVMQLVKQPHPVIGAMYPLKKQGLAWVWTPIPGRVPDQRGVQIVQGIGTGFKCFELEVFEAFAEQHPELSYTNNEPKSDYFGKKITMFFREDILDGQRLPEDFYFDNECIKMGIPVCADTKLHIEHIGECGWLAVNKT
jgi:hypothetical protein